MSEQRVQAIEQCLFFMRVCREEKTVNSNFEYELLSRRIKEIFKLEVKSCRKIQNTH